MEPSLEHLIIPDEEMKLIDLKTCINVNIGNPKFSFFL